MKKKTQGRNPEHQEPDWESIRKSYETGKYSLFVLARLCDVPKSTIYDRAKQEGWAVGVSAAMVKARTREKLATSSSKVVSDRDIELAAATNVHIIREHRGISRRGRELSYKLMNELEERIDNRPAMEAVIESVEQLVEAEGKSVDAIKWLSDKLGTDKIAATLKDLASATKVWVELERKAFNLDDDHGDPTDTMTEEQLNARITQLLGKARTGQTARSSEEPGSEA